MFIDPPNALEPQRVPGLYYDKLGGNYDKLGGLLRQIGRFSATNWAVFFGEIRRSITTNWAVNYEKLGGTYNVKKSEKSLRL